MPVRYPVLMPNGSIQEQDCLTVQELASLLHTTRDAVYRKTGSGQWPYQKVVRQLLFTPEHVRIILAQAEHRPTGAPAQQQAPGSNVRRIGGLS